MTRSKLLALLLVVIMALVLAACGGDEESDETPEPTATVAPTEEPTEEATPTEEPTATLAPTEKPTEEAIPTEEPTATLAPTEKPTEEAAPTEKPTEEATATEEPLKIVFVVNAVIDDQSFFASANRGMVRLENEGYNVDINRVELGIEESNWEPGLADAMANLEYDLLIAGTYEMAQFLGARAHQYPDKHFIMFDAPVPYDDPEFCVEGCPNVYSVTYKQNEGSFLAGVYAAAITNSGIEGTNEDAIIGAIGSQDIPVINDFVVGYEQGACLVNPDIQRIVNYAGGWNDPATGKEIAFAMYEQRADIIFQIAGGTGVGVFEAALEEGRYAIGVDSDQAEIYVDDQPELANRILTSMKKNVDFSLYRAVDLYLKGELPFGEEEQLGIAEGGVGLAYNDIYFDNTPDNILELVDAAEQAVEEGAVSVISSFGEGAYEVGTPCEDMPETSFDPSTYLGE